MKINRTLFEFQKATLTFFDPACGCGNFLAITYRELRLLELDVLRAAHVDGQQMLDIHQLVAVDVDQFYGIEIEEFPAQIAQVALWLVDHQMNLKVSEEFGAYFVRIPLKHSATIAHGNALRVEWNDVLPAERCSFVLGNPPFVGKSNQDANQKADMAVVMHDIHGAGVLDFVAAWYVKAVRYLSANVMARAAFVSPQLTRGCSVGLVLGGQNSRPSHVLMHEARGRRALRDHRLRLTRCRRKTIFEYENIAAQREGHHPLVWM
ncbi:MAG: hypothetical protein IPP41_13620 [Rhodocyclaceae bacterium]|nr:hypothetical protein [Rhodocyclaceae bacterium]